MLELILLAMFVVLILYAVYVYNYALQLKNKADESFSNLSSILERRETILSRIVPLLDDSTTYEQKLLENITKIREGKLESISRIRDEIKTKLMSVEAYPSADALGVMRDYLQQIQIIENNIQMYVDSHNIQVERHNSFIRSFPALIFCSIYGWGSINFFRNVS